MEADYQPHVEQEPRPHEQKSPNRLLTVIVVLLSIWGLKISAPVTLPLAIAIFLIAIFWPLENRLERRMRKEIAIALTLLCFVALVAMLILSLWYAAETVAQKAPQYEEEFNQLVQEVKSQAQRLGIPLSGGSQGSASRSPQSLLSVPFRIASVVAGFFLVLAYLLFGLVEARDYRIKLDKSLGGGRGSRWLSIAQRISSDFLRFVVVRGAVAVATSVQVFLFSLLVGLDFAFIWGLITLILEFIPTVGTFISLVLPMVFAVFQFGMSGKLVLVLLGLGTIQFVMGNIVEPLVEGKYLQLSALVVLISIAFWSWVWGIAGAFIGVPLTIMVVVTCKQFDRTRWIATLLASVDDDQGGSRNAG